MIQKVDKLCRICGKADAQLIPIFSDDGLLHDLRGKIEKHLFSIHVTEKDDLPQQMCYQCTSSLIIWNDLFELSVKIEKKFMDELNKVTLKNGKSVKPVGFNASKKKELDSLGEKISKDEIDESVTEDIFKEIDDFDNFLNQSSPASSSAVDSDSDSVENITIEDDTIQEAFEALKRNSPLGDLKKRRKAQEENTNSNIPVKRSAKQNLGADFIKKAKQTVAKRFSTSNSIMQLSKAENYTSKNTQNLEVTNLTASECTTIDTRASEITCSIAAEPDTFENVKTIGLRSDECDVLSDVSNNDDTNSPLGTVQEKKKPRQRKKSLEGLERRVCHICGKFFKGVDTMRIHVKTVHSTERPHVCGQCNTAFKRKDHLDCHIKYKHGSCSYPKRPTKYGPPITQKRLCVHCGKILSSSQVLKEHINSFHSGNRPYKCEQCNISFSRYSTFYHHTVIRNHKIASFFKTCDLCGLDFQSESFYFKHMWKHPENVFCEICNITFADNELFRKHIDTSHEEEKPFQCSSCGKRFGSKNSLKLHIRVHSGEKPYECQYCSWKFHKKGQLVVHIYRHTGERPYVCDICGRGFKQKGDMRKHKAGHVMQRKKTVAAVLDRQID